MYGGCGTPTRDEMQTPDKMGQSPLSCQHFLFPVLQNFAKPRRASDVRTFIEPVKNALLWFIVI